jgi:hypothetical protein
LIAEREAAVSERSAKNNQQIETRRITKDRERQRERKRERQREGERQRERQRQKEGNRGKRRVGLRVPGIVTSRGIGGDPRTGQQLFIIVNKITKTTKEFTIPIREIDVLIG